MTRRLLISYLSITAFVLLVLEVPLALTFARSEEERLTADVERDARVVATLAEDQLERSETDPPIDLTGFVTDYQDRTGGRVVVVDTQGISIADSDRPDDPARDFSTRPEIHTALTEGREAAGTRFSQTLDQGLLYVAVPVASGGDIHGAVRITYPTGELDRRIRRNWISLALLAAVVLAAVAAVGSVLARSVTRPLRALQATSHSLARGELTARAPADRGPPEVRDLADQFNEMASRLEELVGAQQAFVADASHELRTPLTALRLRLENLRSDVPSAHRGELDAVQREIVRLAQVVEGLLALARAEGGRPERTPVAPSAVAADRAETWRPLAEEQGVTLVVDDSLGPDVRAEAVPGALEQILDNLLANALDVAPEGSTITVRTARSGRLLEVHVIDEGPGLEPHEREHAFDRFWRSETSAAEEGSGLGLAIVAQLARASGGSARLDRAPGGGIDAIVSLRPAP